MDFLEDIDEHTYNDFVPLHLRIAIEDQVFGWDHLLSIIVGHVAYTIVSYLITFWLITFAVLGEVPWGGQHADNADSCASDEGCQSGGDNIPWGMPHTTFSLLRTFMSLASAVSTFRMIRRRRRVWLHQPNDEAELSKSEAQRRASSLEEADTHARRFVIGNRLFDQMQDSYAIRRDRHLSKRVSMKLLKAHRMFERRHKNRVEQVLRSASSSSLVELGEQDRNDSADSVHKRMRMLASPPASVTRKRHRRQRTAPCGSSSLLTASTDSLSLGSDDTVGSASSLEDDSKSGLGSFVPGEVMDSNTLPNFAMESVGHDQMPFSHGEIRRVPYVHGVSFRACLIRVNAPPSHNRSCSSQPLVHNQGLLRSRAVHAHEPALDRDPQAAHAGCLRGDIEARVVRSCSQAHTLGREVSMLAPSPAATHFDSETGSLHSYLSASQQPCRRRLRRRTRDRVQRRHTHARESISL